MGGKIGLIVCALAALSFYGTGHHIQFWSSVVVGVIVFLTYGIMHNYAMESARRRWNRLRKNMILEGREEDIERLDMFPIKISANDLSSVPDGLSHINLFATLLGFALLVWGVVDRFYWGQ